ncbi:hypothetical protein DBR43_15010 [Pedobacter sp. KBW06]|uniref:hypothetical protein n=1 Tax=Pedobacter sp. KBW06 TaxID=2153359 RepID=UPI000F59955D|nr:hypothetical protein [Pedobacter sp. KBW06]RQO69393.1 hypothetical protein DBR43_15010 [Pedobacter sp. KBW06]
MHVLKNSIREKQFVTIAKIDTIEISLINKTKQFDFNWNKEKLFNVYKLTVEENDEPIGLLSLDERSDDYALEIRLLASSKQNIGKSKKYSRIAGCLIAFACKEAFKRGFDGFVCLKPKTKLEAHYIKKYGFRSTKLYLITEGENSLKLIKEYYED